MKVDEDIILIAGPTASGKTSASFAFAKANDAIIINADSMQVYGELRILSARPSQREEEQAPHFLFGHVAGNQPYSVAHWLDDVQPLMQNFLSQGRKLIFVGGTGLYFNALTQGLSPMPEICDAVRQEIRAMKDQTSHQLHAMLDEKAARELRPSDRQRIMRALEIFRSTGKSIVDWQVEKGAPTIPDGTRVKKLLVMPPRAEIHDRINRRFDAMIEEGALHEVEALLQKSYPETASVMKAIGVPQLSAYLASAMSLEAAMEKAKAATRQYAKRQSTWFNNSFGEGWERY